MTCVYHDARKRGYRLEVYVRGLRRKLWLGRVSKKQADAIRQHIDALKIAAETATQPETSALLWTKEVDSRIRDTLARWGLIKPAVAASSIRLKDWCDQVRGMKKFESWAKSTRYQMEKVAELLVSQIGDKPIDQIDESDAEEFAAYVYGLGSGASETHAGKQIKRARQYFNEAIKSRMIDKNPFSAVRASTQIDKSRKAYVTPEEAKSILEKCPDQLWRVIFCLARYCGLRVPSEILTLEWTAIDWERSRLTVTAPKQKRHAHRYIRTLPLSPDVLRELRDLQEQAGEGAVWVCDRYRSVTSTAHFRKPLLNAIAAAGLEPWPKLWMNLRASARTDLKKVVPVHVVNEWLGHDTKVGEMHYDRVTDADWAAVTAPTLAPTTKPKNEKGREIPA